MKVVARDPKDSLQHLVQIKGGENGLARVIQNRNFCHSKGILSSGAALTEVPKVTHFFGRNNAFLIVISPTSPSRRSGCTRRQPDKTTNPKDCLSPAAMGDAEPQQGRKRP